MNTLNNLEFIPTYNDNDDVKKDQRFYLYKGRHEKKEKHIKVYLTFTEQEYKIIQKIREKKRISNLLNELIDTHIFEKEEGKWIWICPICHNSGCKPLDRKECFKNGKNHMCRTHNIRRGDPKLQFYIMNTTKNSINDNVAIKEYLTQNGRKADKWEKWIWICPKCQATAWKPAGYNSTKNCGKQHMDSKHGSRELSFVMQKINITNGIKVCQENCKKCVFGGCRGAKCRNQNAQVIFQIDGWYCQSMKERDIAEKENKPLEILVEK